MMSEVQDALGAAGGRFVTSTLCMYAVANPVAGIFVYIDMLAAHASMSCQYQTRKWPHVHVPTVS